MDRHGARRGIRMALPRLFFVVAAFFLLCGCGQTAFPGAANAGLAVRDTKLGGAARSTPAPVPGRSVPPAGRSVYARDVLAHPSAVTATVSVSAAVTTVSGSAAFASGSAVSPLTATSPGAYAPGPASASTAAARAYDFTPAELDGMSSEKIGWGVKLDGHERPKVAEKTSVTLEKYNTVYISSADEPVLYLTFDMGYENGYTPSILDTLKEHDVPAAFFITGHYLSTQPELVRRIVTDGHMVGNHTDGHRCLPEEPDAVVESELLDFEAAYSEATGFTLPKYMRPPSGEYSERSLALTARLGYRTVLWSFAYVDYDEQQARGEAYAYQKITDNLHNGAVVLLHTESKENAAVLGRVIQTARDMGFTFATLGELQ